jgi:hypothetical protein
MRGQGAPISIGQAASIQLAVCGAYAFALHLAATDEAGLVARLVRGWVALIDSLVRSALRGEPVPIGAAAEAPCWRCHLMAFCLVCVCLFIMWTRQYWPLWAHQLSARFRRDGAPYVRVARAIAAGRAQTGFAAAAAALFLLFPNASLANGWYMVIAPFAAAAASFCLAWFFVLRRLPA